VVGSDPCVLFAGALSCEFVDIPTRFNLTAHLLDRHLHDGHASDLAVISGDQHLTYQTITALVDRTASGLRSLGLLPEQRCLIVLPDSPEFIAAYLGAIKTGAVAVPTSTALRTADYAYFLEESGARIAIVHSSLWAEFGPALAINPATAVVCGDPVEGALHWDTWLRAASAGFDPAPTHKDDAAFWLWTSGSTGRPKAAVHTHQDWVHCCESYARGVLGITAADITFSSSKLFHAYGLGNGLVFPFHVGATTVLHAGRPQPRTVLDTITAQRPTLFFSVPTLYAAMLNELDQGYPCAFDSIRLAASAAEPLPAAIYQRWRDRTGVEILDGIGSTEVLHIYLSARAGRVRPGSTGQAVPGYELRIVDGEGAPVPPGTIGDLLVAGPSTALSYWHRADLTRDRMRGRWFFTGDKYSIDEDGYYWYAGRSDDMFRVSGQWLSPAEVEAALIEHPLVLEAAVIAHQEETQLHTPAAFVVLKDGTAGTPELVRELQDFVKSRITPYKYPRRITFLPELPKSAAGKLLRYKLREL